jgi:hypothetical protein
MEALLTILLSDKLGVSVGALGPRDPQAEEFRKKIREGLTAEKKA